MLKKRRTPTVLLAAIGIGAVVGMAAVRHADAAGPGVAVQASQISVPGDVIVSDPERRVGIPTPIITASPAVSPKPAELKNRDVADRVGPPGPAESLATGSSVPAADVSDSTKPDLVTLPPSELHIRYDVLGIRRLHFTNSILNQGPAPLEVHGRLNPSSGLSDVFQRMSWDGEPFDERLIGSFVYHPSHHHWHIEAVASYELWSVDTDNVLSRSVMRSRKASYCLRDDIHLHLESHPESWPEFAGYLACENVVQGISPGWLDAYLWYTPGQDFDVSSISDGTYALVSTANPSGFLIESDLDNNVATTVFQLTGDTIVILKSASGELESRPPLRRFDYDLAASV